MALFSFPWASLLYLCWFPSSLPDSGLHSRIHVIDVTETRQLPPRVICVELSRDGGLRMRKLSPLSPNECKNLMRGLCSPCREPVWHLCVEVAEPEITTRETVQ